MARDIIHDAVRKALEKDKWLITDDPLDIRLEGTTLYIDLATERVLEAQKGKEQIIVEIKSLSKRSLLESIYGALGQYIIYRDALEEVEIKRAIYLAIAAQKYERLKEIPFLLRSLEKNGVKLIIVNIKEQKIEAWKK
ncbi:MAG: element excision factor XisH family protein [Bacteroidota bacterium]